jgi:hypothetical protein
MFLPVWFFIYNICLTQKDTIPIKKLDLSDDPSTNEKRDRETVRELLQMTACRKVKDTSKKPGKLEVLLLKSCGWKKRRGKYGSVYDSAASVFSA